MHIRPSAKDFWCCIWAVIFLAGFSGLAYGETKVEISWQNMESKYVIIYYQTPEDLERFDEEIDYSPEGWGVGNLFSSSGSGADMEKRKKKMDALYERVQQILDMRKKMEKVRIKIYKDKRQLQNAFQSIFMTRRENIRAWYIFEFNTIYVNVDDLHEVNPGKVK